MRPAAKLLAESILYLSIASGAYCYHPNFVAVLFTEQCHSTQLLRLLFWQHRPDNGQIGTDFLTDQILDPLLLLGSKRLGICEIEPEIIRADVTALLGDRFAENLLQGPLEKMRCGVILFYCGPVFADNRPDIVTGTERAFGDFTLASPRGPYCASRIS